MLLHSKYFLKKMATETKNIVDASNEDVNNDGIRERMARNRERALLLRKAKIVAHPYAKRYV